MGTGAHVEPATYTTGGHVVPATYTTAGHVVPNTYAITGAHVVPNTHTSAVHGVVGLHNGCHPGLHTCQTTTYTAPVVNTAFAGTVYGATHPSNVGICLNTYGQRVSC